jgi:enediyne biosynthesis protein E4
VLPANTFASAIAVNDGTGKFTLRSLPGEAQLAPVYAALADDFDHDGRIDLLLGGNFYGVPPIIGRYDASYGLLLRGDAGGRFHAVGMEASNLLIDGQVRRLKKLRGADGAALVAVARNGDRLEILRVSGPR